MLRPRRALSLLGLALLLAPLVPGRAAAAERTVVVLLFDGAAPALLEGAETPALARIREEGAWSHAVAPPFPSISLIGGVTVSTGCWPARHGIVTNKFLDPERGLFDHARDADWLVGCEHLHVAAERQGVPAAALGWYGSHSGSRGPLAGVVGETRWEDFPDDAGRAEQVAELLARTDAARPRLILAYFQGPDTAAHFEGMDAPETRAAVEAMDAAVARVMRAVETGPHADHTALFVTTDHGMRPVTHMVNVARVLANREVEGRAVSTGTTAFVYLDDPTQADEAAARLDGAEAWEVLRKGALPDYARLGEGPRVPELILSARPPYIAEDAGTWPSWLRWLADWGPETAWAGPFVKASHGYPPHVEGMDGILYAWGDGVAPGRAGSVRAVDVHPTVMRLLGLEPGRPVDGEALEAFLAR